MVKFIASAAAALMLGSAALITPAAAFGTSPNVQIQSNLELVANRADVKKAEKRRVAKRKHCTVKKVVTHRHGKRIVRNVRTCR